MKKLTPASVFAAVLAPAGVAYAAGARRHRPSDRYVAPERDRHAPRGRHAYASGKARGEGHGLTYCTSGSAGTPPVRMRQHRGRRGEGVQRPGRRTSARSPASRSRPPTLTARAQAVPR